MNSFCKNYDCCQDCNIVMFYVCPVFNYMYYVKPCDKRAELRAKIEVKLQKNKEKKNTLKRSRPPVYDDIYWKGLAWLDDIAFSVEENAKWYKEVNQGRENKNG